MYVWSRTSHCNQLGPFWIYENSLNWNHFLGEVIWIFFPCYNGWKVVHSGTILLIIASH
jgi:hypothetical protein